MATEMSSRSESIENYRSDVELHSMFNVASDQVARSPSVYKELWRTAKKTDRLLYGSGIIFSIASGTILPLMTLVFGNFVTIFTNFSTGTLDPDDFEAKVDHYTLYFLYLFIAKAGCAYLSMTLFSIVSTRVTSSIRRSYLQSMLHKPIAYHETTSSSGDISVSLSSHCNTIQSGLADKFGLSLQSISTVVAAFVVAFTSQWKLTLVTATIVPATVAIVGVTGFFDSKVEAALNATNTAAATVAEELLSSIRTALALRATEKLLHKHRSYLDRAVTLGRKRAPIVGAQVMAYMFMMFAAYALAFWYGIHLYAEGESGTAGSIATSLFSILIGTNSFAQLATYLGPFLRINSAASELFSTMQPLKTNELANTINPRPAETEDIEFRDVTFSYPLRPNIDVLKDLSLIINKGKMTALVGPSGSGKSTIVGLLERWYDAKSGSLMIGERNVQEIAIEEVRKRIGLVQQEPTLFSATVMENVLYGIDEKKRNSLTSSQKMVLVEDACKLANANEFIRRLPEGYHTNVGHSGGLLSGGQRQRIAIARAVIGDPKILIFDEATSALDPVAERAVQIALDQASNGRTTIAIAHKLSSIRHADKIVVISNGKVCEEGPHDLLALKDDGVYRRLLAAQSLVSQRTPSLEVSSRDEELSVKPETAESAVVEESEQKISQIGVLKVLGLALYEQRRFWLVYAVLFSCCGLGGLMYSLQAFLYSEVMDVFSLTGPSLTSRGNFWSLIYFILALVNGAAYFVIGGASAYIEEIVSQSYRSEYLRSMIQQPVSFFDKPSNSPGALTARLSTDPDSLKSISGSNLGVMVVVVVTIISTSVLSLAIGWKLALVAIFGALPFIFAAGLIRETMEHKFEKIVEDTFAGSVGYAAECIRAIRTVKSLNMESTILARFSSILDQHCLTARTHTVKSMLWFALSESIELLCMGLAFWYGGHLLATHEYSTQQFFIVFIAIVFGSQSSGQFFAHSLDVSKGAHAFCSIVALREETQQFSTGDGEVPRRAECETPLLEFRDAAFAYPLRRSHLVLAGLNLKMQEGQFIALVGPSGCGKSTILALLEKFYDLNSGVLLVRGKNVQEISSSSMRVEMSLVPQEPTLYQGTIRENILIGVGDSLTDSELDEIAKKAQIYDLIKSLPEGYGTEVGARGTALSGGQKQRVAIARAIAQQSSILLLDEATSALDSESEALVYEALKNAGKSKSVVAVAHRLSTIQHADQIFVISDGAVAEHGTHLELLEKQGIYFQMCQLQGLS